MKRSTSVRAIVVGAAAVLLAAWATTASAQTGSLRGKVVDSNGKPVDQAEVTFDFVGDYNRQLKTITDKKILSSRPFTTANMAGFEYLAEGKGASGRPLRYLVVVLYPAGRPFVLLGIAPSERFEEALPEFRKMVESFRAKP